MRNSLLLILIVSFLSVNAQSTENNIIVVKQIGRHYYDFRKAKRSSIKTYYFNPNGNILKVIKYGRHDYAYLNVVGSIDRYYYHNDTVIEIDTIFYNESNEIYNVTIDTLSLDLLNRKLYYDVKFNKFDSNQRLIQSTNDFRQVIKYEYNEKRLVSRIVYYFSDDENNLLKTDQLVFRWKNTKRISSDTIERLNNFILWQYELGI